MLHDQELLDQEQKVAESASNEEEAKSHWKKWVHAFVEKSRLLRRQREVPRVSRPEERKSDNGDDRGKTPLTK